MPVDPKDKKKSGRCEEKWNKWKIIVRQQTYIQII